MPGPMQTWNSGAMRLPSSDHTVLADSSSEDAGPDDDCDDDGGRGDDLG